MSFYIHRSRKFDSFYISNSSSYLLFISFWLSPYCKINSIGHFFCLHIQIHSYVLDSFYFLFPEQSIMDVHRYRKKSRNTRCCCFFFILLYFIILLLLFVLVILCWFKMKAHLIHFFFICVFFHESNSTQLSCVVCARDSNWHL